MTDKTLHVFIGYDDREDEAYKVCRYSIVRRSSEAVSVHPLKHKPLRDMGLFDRPWRISESGQYVDERDGRPFSTQFSHSRFLVPEYAKKLGISGWALFVDCDFLFRANLAHLFELADPEYALMCVQHEHIPDETLKMDGVEQTRYYRKNWSSLMLFNLDHPLNKDLDIDAVNHKPGSWLHSFGWLPDEAIGDLPAAWNWIEGVSPRILPPKAVHYSVGGPWFENYRDVAFAQEWIAERAMMSRIRAADLRNGQ